MDLIDEHVYEQTMKNKVLPSLARCSHEGWMGSYQAGAGDGFRSDIPTEDTGDPRKRLHYVCYDASEFQDATPTHVMARYRGAIVISHGFSEFGRKYEELAWYFLMAGYSVCILDHWGHGLSGRGVDDPNLVWVDNWERYVADLAGFCTQVAQTYAGEHPLYLYAHSMGAAIGARMLERFPDIIGKAVLSSPMIEPKTGHMPLVALAAADAACAVGMGEKPVPGFRPFDANLDMSKYKHGSQARVGWAHQLRVGQTWYQTSQVTYQWIKEALQMCRELMRPDQCAQVEAPILLFQAEPDRFVLPKAQEKFAAQVRDGGCEVELVKVPHSMHELYEMPNAVLGPYLDRIFSFFEQPYVLLNDEASREDLDDIAHV